jgi:hypothetical protein
MNCVQHVTIPLSGLHVPAPHGGLTPAGVVGGVVSTGAKYTVTTPTTPAIPPTPPCPHLELVSYWHTPKVKDWTFTTPVMELASKRKNAHITIPQADESDRLYHYFNTDEQYVTFEPDQGGWNNIRMQMEVVLVFALVTGRTLVLPFDQPMYLLMNGKGKENVHSFDDYFAFDWISKRLSVISMEEFLRREGITGRLYRQNTTTSSYHGVYGSNEAEDMKINNNKIYPPLVTPSVPPKIVYPPGNKTVHNCGIREVRWALFDYLREVGACPKFHNNYKQ